jgi:arsenite methyltransferase
MSPPIKNIKVINISGKEAIMKNQQTFFDFAAEVGLTKHIGGVEATEALIELCHIGEGKYVLDIGCGVGVTPCFIARKYGCRVVGVDILDTMVKRSRERAKREGVMDRVEFRVADAQDLPFEDDLFDAVITESVTAFPEDKQKAVNEYVRVTKPGGYVGLSESAWLKVPPPPELVAWAGQDLGANITPLTSSEWVGLLETAGLRETVVKTYELNVQDESKGILRRYGCGGLLGVMWRMLSLYVKSPAYRKFVKEARKEGITPKNLDEYFGYGLYAGRK